MKQIKLNHHSHEVQDNYLRRKYHSLCIAVVYKCFNIFDTEQTNTGRVIYAACS